MPRQTKSKSCPYKVSWFGRALWIADRYKLPFELVERDLWNMATFSGPGFHSRVVEGHMLAENPVCNVGCSLCHHIREKSGSPLPPLRQLTPRDFVREVAASSDPRVMAAVDQVLKTSRLMPRLSEPPGVAPHCSFCNRYYAYTGPMMVWTDALGGNQTLRICKRCAEMAIVNIDLQLEDSLDEKDLQPPGVRPEVWERIVDGVEQSDLEIKRREAWAASRKNINTNKAPLPEAEVARRIAIFKRLKELQRAKSGKRRRKEK